MAKFFAPFWALLTLILFTVVSLFWAGILFILSPFLLIPLSSFHRILKKIMYRLPIWWTDSMGFVITLTKRVEWDLSGMEDLSMNDWYLMIANHRSWLDILVLQQVFNRKIPSLRFFMKRELLWQLPVLGVACWLLDFPFMQRYSKDVLTKHPELKGKDIETTRRVCEKFKNIPITMINFVEGGRFSAAKHRHQQSPYRYLLKPKAGGMAFVLATMGDYLHKILDVTLIYPNMRGSFWDFLCGRISKISVHVRAIPITAELLGDYQNDEHFRSFFQYWLNELWEEKDKLIMKTLRQQKFEPQQQTVFTLDGR